MKLLITYLLLIYCFLLGITASYIVLTIVSFPNLTDYNEKELYLLAHATMVDGCSDYSIKACTCVRDRLLHERLPSEILQMQERYFKTTELDPYILDTIKNCMIDN